MSSQQTSSALQPRRSRSATGPTAHLGQAGRVDAPTGLPDDLDELVALVRSLTIDPDVLVDDVRALAALGSSDLGFRVTGTDEDRAAAAHVTARMSQVGLVDVAVEDVAVDAWRFRGASVAAAGGPTCRAASFGGVPGTGPDGVSGPLVDVGDGARARLDALDLVGAVALVDWQGPTEPVAVGLELARRGAVAMVLSCPPGGPYHQAEGAIGSFGSRWHPDAPPVVTGARGRPAFTAVGRGLLALSVATTCTATSRARRSTPTRTASPRRCWRARGRGPATSPPAPGCGTSWRPCAARRGHEHRAGG